MNEYTIRCALFVTNTGMNHLTEEHLHKPFIREEYIMKHSVYGGILCVLIYSFRLLYFSTFFYYLLLFRLL